MAGYSQTRLFKKLGYKSGTRALVVNASTTYRGALTLPAGMEPVWLEKLGKGVELIHVFVDRKADLARLARLARRNLAPAGALWISWSKKSSGVPTEIDESVVRKVILPLGLVDIKVCAVDEIWSGLKCVIRRELR